MNLNHVIDQVARDKGIDRTILVETLEAAILTAAKRTFGGSREIEAEYNEDKGEVELYQIITVVDPEDVENPFREISSSEASGWGVDAEAGDELCFQIYYRQEDREKALDQDKSYGPILKIETARTTFGRIAAQTAKQVIIQRVREAERDMVFNEYKDRASELVTGIVRRFDKGNLIVDLDFGRTDAILPRREQAPRETYRPNDRIQAIIKEVRRSSREPQVVLSRADPQLLMKLFEAEVPEMYEGIVRIVACAREPGVRSKVAVYSRDSDVDPVGACVGMRGSRVQAVVQELRGEKIDIVLYQDDPARFVCNAISPAEVSKVLLDEANKTMELIVPDDQLSLAIGRGGQNVRLAAQLTGWNLDIISETRLRTMMAEARKSLLEYEGVVRDMIDTLFTLGYSKLEHIALAEPAELSQIPGFGLENAERLIAAARDVLERPSDVDGELSQSEVARRALQEIKGVGEKVAKRLYEAGYYTPRHVFYEESAEALDLKTGIGLKKARQLQEAIVEFFTDQDIEVDTLNEEKPQWAEARQAEADARTATRTPNMALLSTGAFADATKVEEEEEEVDSL
jgi:transcription termination/antitermination protein NusA